MLKTALGRFRAVALLEGVSYVLLLAIAMPLKYFADWPLGVRVVGSAHGALFVVFVLALAHVAAVQGWGLRRISAAFIWSLVPAGTFVFDRSLAREEPRED